MAKTNRRGKRRIGRQGPLEASTPQEMLDAITRPSEKVKLKVIREIGVLDAKGNIGQRYRSWGKRVSRTQCGSWE
jgi:hypothetical protein